MAQLLKDRAQEELEKLFRLAAAGVTDLTMPSKAIDDVWHALLTERDAYERFSMAACGRVIAHRPNEGEGSVAWTREYESRFGMLDPIWFTDQSGVLDRAAYERYLDTGRFKASWDCSPE
ncbi:MAG: hypothetical protein ACRDYX_19485 [Egibacteraceae bacterium]